MSGALGLLALVAVLIVANGVFVAAEFAFVAVPRAPIEERALAGDRRARAVTHQLRNLSFALSGAQFGITLTSLLVGYLAEPAVAELLRPVLVAGGLPEGSALAVSLTAAFLLSTVVQMVVGELAPKNLAIARPEPVALALAGTMRAYELVFGPIIRVFDGAARWLSRVFGVEIRDELMAGHSVDELSRIIAASGEEGLLTPEQTELLMAAVDLAERRVASVMVPRPDIVWAERDAPLESLRELARTTGHSRFPVRGESEDDLVGSVHVKDLLAGSREEPPAAVGDVATPALVVPEGYTLRRLLADLRRDGRTFAVVADEYGAVAGLVTLEDVLEELVGEIEDEFDREAAPVRRIGAGSYLVSGALRIDRASEMLGLDIPDGPYETLAGFVLDRLGRIPSAGEVLAHGHWDIRVERVDGRRLAELRLSRARWRESSPAPETSPAPEGAP